MTSGNGNKTTNKENRPDVSFVEKELLGLSINVSDIKKPPRSLYEIGKSEETKSLFSFTPEEKDSTVATLLEKIDTLQRFIDTLKNYSASYALPVSQKNLEKFRLLEKFLAGLDNAEFETCGTATVNSLCAAVSVLTVLLSKLCQNVRKLSTTWNPIAKTHSKKKVQEQLSYLQALLLCCSPAVSLLGENKEIAKTMKELKLLSLAEEELRKARSNGKKKEEYLSHANKAVGYYKEAAQLGNAKSFVALGRLFRRDAVLKNSTLAKHWYLQAMEVSANKEVYRALGELYWAESVNSAKDLFGTAESFFEKAAGLGCAKSLNRLGQLKEAKGELLAAKAFYKRAAVFGNADALNNEGCVGLKLLGFLTEGKKPKNSANPKRLKENVGKLERSGTVFAFLNLGALYANREFPLTDAKRAVGFFGHAEALLLDRVRSVLGDKQFFLLREVCWKLGNLYRERRDYELAFRYLDLVVFLGTDSCVLTLEAKFVLAEMFEVGQFVKKDLSKARLYYNLYLEGTEGLNKFRALYRTAKINYSESFSELNQKAVKQFEECAENGIGEAYIRLGEINEEKGNLENAKKLYQKAAEAGLSEGTARLEILYNN